LHGLGTEPTGSTGVASLDRPPWLLVAGVSAICQASGGVVGLRRPRGREGVAERCWAGAGR
jgi:hypothetical protein